MDEGKRDITDAEWLGVKEEPTTPVVSEAQNANIDNNVNNVNNSGQPNAATVTPPVAVPAQDGKYRTMAIWAIILNSSTLIIGMVAGFLALFGLAAGFGCMLGSSSACGSIDNWFSNPLAILMTIAIFLVAAFGPIVGIVLSIISFSKLPVGSGLRKGIIISLIPYALGVLMVVLSYL